MRAEHTFLSPDEIDQLVELVAERVVTLLEERRASWSTADTFAGNGDLAARLAAALTNGPATVPELARRVRLRDETVRRIVQSDSRFLLVPPPSGRSPKAKCWALLRDAVSAPGRLGTNSSPEGGIA